MSQIFDAENLGLNTAPDHLFYNVHLSLMFQRILKNHTENLENVVRQCKIYSNLLLNATVANSMIEQALAGKL